MGLGTSLAGFSPQMFTSTSGLEFSAQTMSKDTVWVLVLSPPDPLAGLWAGTIGAGGVINWPTAIDPNPPSGGLGDENPCGILQLRLLGNTQIDTGVTQLDAGDSFPLVP